MAEQKPEPEPAQPGEPTASGSTPVKPSAISLFRYARIFPEVQKQRVMLVDDMSGRWIGPVPVDVFLEELMYYSEFLTDDDKPPSKIKFPESTTKETDMYKPFVSLKLLAVVLHSHSHNILAFLVVQGS